MRWLMWIVIGVGVAWMVSVWLRREGRRRDITRALRFPCQEGNNRNPL